MLPPYQQATGSDWYKGTANAIYQNISFIDRYDPQYVIILSGDQTRKQDYADFLRFHKEKNAEFSVAVMEVPWSEAPRFGLMVMDENDRISDFQEKPEEPQEQPGFHGHLYLQLGYPEKVPHRGRKTIPTVRTTSARMSFPHCCAITAACTLTVSVAIKNDVGTISSLWQANMEVLDPTRSRHQPV